MYVIHTYSMQLIMFNQYHQAPSSLIIVYLLTGNGLDYMNLALQDGGVALTVKLGIGKLDTQIKTDSVRFDDNQWHHVLVSRESSKVNLNLSSFLYKKLCFLFVLYSFKKLTVYFKLNLNVKKIESTLKKARFEVKFFIHCVFHFLLTKNIVKTRGDIYL